jgi:hypothetical protein
VGQAGEASEGKGVMEVRRIGNSAVSGNFEFMWTRIEDMWNLLIGLTSWL